MTIGQWEIGAWQIFGYGGQICFFSRFLVQWVVSEKKKRSVIPIAFWYLSLIGTTILLTYAISQRDAVFTVGQACGFFVYIRNLMLIRKEKQRARIQDPDQVKPAQPKP